MARTVPRLGSLVPRSVQRRRRWRTASDAQKDFFRLAREYTPYVAAELRGNLLLVATADDTHEATFLENPKEHRLLTRVLEGLQGAGIDVLGKTFVDVGANNGTASFAALAAGFSRVVACEPGADAYRLLRANLALNDAEDVVTAVNAALSSTSGVGHMDLTRGSRKGYLFESSGPDRHRRSQEVRLARLDDLVDEGLLDPNEVGLLWMDVEGHESHVLLGATRVLSVEPPPPVVLELHPKRLRQSGTVDTIVELLPRYFTHFLELRAKFDRPSFTPIEALGDLVGEVEERWAATDLLVCRLPR